MLFPEYMLKSSLRTTHADLQKLPFVFPSELDQSLWQKWGPMQLFLVGFIQWCKNAHIFARSQLDKKPVNFIWYLELIKNQDDSNLVKNNFHNFVLSLMLIISVCSYQKHGSTASNSNSKERTICGKDRHELGFWTSEALHRNPGLSEGHGPGILANGMAGELQGHRHDNQRGWKRKGNREILIVP